MENIIKNKLVLEKLHKYLTNQQPEKFWRNQKYRERSEIFATLICDIPQILSF
jgi:hypothetical protein